MGSKNKVPVSERALIQRINRRLAKDEQVLKTSRSVRMRLDCGWFYIVDTNRNFIAEKEVDLEGLGRELGVLADYEWLDLEE